MVLATNDVRDKVFEELASRSSTLFERFQDLQR